MNLFGVYAAFSMKMSAYFRWMAAFVIWIIGGMVYILVIIVSGNIDDLAVERCRQDLLCGFYGSVRDGSCVPICNLEVRNQLIGEVVLVGIFVTCAALFAFRLMYGLYNKIERFYEKFPDYDRMRMRVVPEEEKPEENFVIEEAEEAEDFKYERKEEIKETEALLEQKEPVEEKPAPMLKIYPISESVYDDKKYAPSSSDESFEEFKSGTCAFPGCDEEALDLQCPICFKSENPPVDSFYCCQDHFNRSWKEHKAAYHSNL